MYRTKIGHPLLGPWLKAWQPDNAKKPVLSNNEKQMYEIFLIK
jgi:hypothetical protein